MKKPIYLFIAALIAMFFAGCGQTAENDNAITTGEDTSVSTGNVNIKMVVADYGDIYLELYPEIAPITVENFTTLVEDGFYDGLTFHRIIDGFMIQGGDPDGTGNGGPGYGIKGEFAANGVANGISHERGVISMARAKDPDSAGSQFFIVQDDSTYLDGNYAAFGRVTDGIEIVDEIAKVPTDMYDRPLNPVVIESIEIIEE